MISDSNEIQKKEEIQKKRPLRSLFSSFSKRTINKTTLVDDLQKDKKQAERSNRAERSERAEPEEQEQRTEREERNGIKDDKKHKKRKEKDAGEKVELKLEDRIEVPRIAQIPQLVAPRMTIKTKEKEKEEVPISLSTYLNVKSLKELEDEPSRLPLVRNMSSSGKQHEKLDQLELPEIEKEKRSETEKEKQSETEKEKQSETPEKPETLEINKIAEIKDKITISTIKNISNFLGESPFYQPETDRVYWVDILKGTLMFWCSKTGQIGRWDLKQHIGCAVPIKQSPNSFLISLTKGLGLFDIQTETWSHTYANPEHHLLTNRWNDGKCGPDGVLWIGSMNGFSTEKSLKEGLREGSLYCLDCMVANPVMRKRLDYIGISNGIAWSKSGLLMYYIDSFSQKVSEYHYYPHQLKKKDSSVNSTITPSRLDLIKIDKIKGSPDGCAMDADDNLWIALWNGYAIEQYSTKDGSLLNHVALPDRYITSLTWFGPELDKLFVTSAMSDSLVEILDDLQKEEGRENKKDTSVQKGRIYVIDFSKTQVRGLPVNSFEIPVFSS